MASRTLLVVGWALVVGAGVSALWRFRSLDKRSASFSAVTHYFSDLGGAKSNVRPLFILWSSSFAFMSGITASFLLQAKSASVVLYIPILLFTAGLIGIAVFPHDTMTTAHYLSVATAAIFLAVVVASLAATYGGVGRMLMALAVLLVTIVYSSFEITQRVLRRGIGINPQHENGPLLQKLFFAVIIIIHIWFLAWVLEIK